ncbi:VanZ family protein [Paenibacillus sp. HJL G12]|uniref:VanZ family protein n=1 Tax=Paenibacillus dendrobii TaxID=2691084 RepID=A0A7X3IH12_9BACL|nr:VanZ family protein [Paenibacillus dendrobii]MWV43316.1 VanZ family protein [Paenibacillus dendrobii]
MNPNNYRILKWLAWIIFLGYSACLFYWMFRGFGRTTREGFSYNLMPLTTIFSYIFNMNRHNIGTTIINLAGNIGVFMPFGVILPFIFEKLRRYSLFLACFTGSILILEFMQTVLRVGTGDIDDVILNDIGASAGFILYRFCVAKRSRDGKTDF